MRRKREVDGEVRWVRRLDVANTVNIYHGKKDDE